MLRLQQPRHACAARSLCRSARIVNSIGNQRKKRARRGTNANGSGKFAHKRTAFVPEESNYRRLQFGKQFSHQCECDSDAIGAGEHELDREQLGKDNDENMSRAHMAHTTESSARLTNRSVNRD